MLNQSFVSTMSSGLPSLRNTEEPRLECFMVWAVSLGRPGHCSGPAGGGARHQADVALVLQDFLANREHQEEGRKPCEGGVSRGSKLVWAEATVNGTAGEGAGPHFE